jgi:dimethylamine monooxygenase subunit A
VGDLGAVTWLDELRFVPGPPFQTMGTRGLDLAEWLVRDDRADGELDQKRRLIADRRDVVVAGAVDGPAAREAWLAVQEWCDEQGWASIAAARATDDAALVRAALAVQDDLAVMERVDGQWVLSAGVVCFPSTWRLSDKAGLPLAGIHEHVPHYPAELSDKVDRFHDRLTVDKPAWRRNWSIVTTPELHLPSRDDTPPLDGPIAPDGSPVWLRSERQTLRRMPVTDAILFTIRVQLAPLGVLLDRPDLAARMLATIESWDAERMGYKSERSSYPELIAWLRGVTG